jgi:hypothetical protein
MQNEVTANPISYPTALWSPLNWTICTRSKLIGDIYGLISLLNLPLVTAQHHLNKERDYGNVKDLIFTRTIITLKCM